MRQHGEPLRPTLQEVERNWRARSSAVHVLEKLWRSSPQLKGVTRSWGQRFCEPTLKPMSGVAADGPESTPIASCGVPQTATAVCRQWPPHMPASSYRSSSRGTSSVYVGNLSFKTTAVALRDHFQCVATVVNAELFYEYNDRVRGIQASPKGCGLVEFRGPEAACKAIREMNNTILDGRPIFVREDRHRPYGYGYRYPAPTTEEVLHREEQKASRAEERDASPVTQDNGAVASPDPIAKDCEGRHQNQGEESTARKDSVESTSISEVPAKPPGAVGSKVAATADFSPREAASHGYVKIRRGDIVTILYQGSEPPRR